MPLLTHDETGAASVARQAHRDRVARRSPDATVVARSGGVGGGPPRRGGGAAGGTGGRKPRRRWLRWTLGVLGTLILVPFLAFVIGWMLFKVPTADDATAAQVSTYTFDDAKEPIAVVRPENGNRIKVSLDKVPEPVRNAVLSAEDATFYSNPGFDFTGILRAVYNQVTGGVGGGSTITQQYIKVSTGQDEASGFGGLWRKYKEIVLAVKISREQDKNQILENYLNTIYLGRGAYGIQSASQAYFGKDVGQLTQSEGALLAGIIQSPSKWDPAKSLPDAQRRWTFVMDQMVQNKFISATDRAQAVFPETQPPKAIGGGVPDNDRFHIFQRAKAELAAKGITEQEIETEGLTVVTTINQNDQDQAVKAVNQVSKGQPDNLRYAVTSIDPRTGAILAYYGGSNISFDYAGVGRRQPGSSYKPFVFAAALEAGKNIGLGTRFDGSSPQTIKGIKVANSEGVSCDNCTVLKAMTQSVNTVFYNMAAEIGPQNVVDAAHAAGIPKDLADKAQLGIALGDQDVHPIDMASAYSTFAAEGTHREPYLVKKVTASDGRVLYEAPEAPAGDQAFPAQVAGNVTASMLDVASASGLPLAGGRPVASKSGTAQNEGIEGQNRDAWYVGYTPQISTAVWVGSDKSDAIKNSAGRPIYGRMLPGQIWQRFMNAALKGEDVEQFPQVQPMGDPPVVEGDDSDGDGEDNGEDDGDDYGDNGDRGNRGDGNDNDAAFYGTAPSAAPISTPTPGSVTARPAAGAAPATAAPDPARQPPAQARQQPSAVRSGSPPTQPPR